MPDQAVMDFLVAHKMDPKSENLMVSITKSYLLADKVKVATIYVDRLMALKTTPTEAFLLRAKIKLQTNKYAESLTDLNRYIDSKGNDNEVYLLRAKVNYLLDRKPAACEDIHAYEKMSATSQEILRKEICEN
jgi:regulator of sirC expression with transglutaminase-like and TPR domain